MTSTYYQLNLFILICKLYYSILFFSIPDGFELTDPEIRAKDGHGWLINPFPENFPIYVPFVSILPAMLFYVLLFVTTEVSE